MLSIIDNNFLFYLIIFQERVGSIYLLYALYYLQPSHYSVKIRITTEQMIALNRFIDQRIRPYGHLDTIYVLYKLIANNAFSIVAYTESVCRFHLNDSIILFCFSIIFSIARNTTKQLTSKRNDER